MWWGMATLTTVGYGDVAPVTVLGQLFGIFTMIIGIGMFALPDGIIATGFSEEMEKHNFVVNWKLVSKVPFFKDLDVTDISEIVSLLTPITLPDKYAVMKVGEKEFSSLKTGSILEDGDKIRTGNSGFDAIIFKDDKSTLKIKENSEAVITGQRTTKNISKKINLDGGTIRASISLSLIHI